jgi:hypothetical protein
LLKFRTRKTPKPSRLQSEFQCSDPENTESESSSVCGEVCGFTMDRDLAAALVAFVLVTAENYQFKQTAR